jgi:hypothetical protein
MSEALDWMFKHAIALIGGVLLFVGLAAVIVVASKSAGRRKEEALEKKDPRDGE